MDSFLNIARALSDKSRVRALLALGDREICVCQLIELLQLAPSTVSKHMSVLKHAGLVIGKKKGRWMYYRQADATAPADVRNALKWVGASLLPSPRIKADKRRLAAILRVNRDELCRRQNTR